jgi:hypothetical protein
MGTVRGSLNLQDSVENSFREKLVIQVRKEVRGSKTGKDK